MNRLLPTLIILGVMLVFGEVPVAAKNPLTSYFAGLLDESRAELAAGKFLVETLASKSSSIAALTSDPDLDAVLNDLIPRSMRNTLPYKILVLENPVPGEIPFPGGTIVITRGTLNLIQSDQERQFIVARNLTHIALRHPMLVIKREGLYARILRLLKNRRHPKHEEMSQRILQEYFGAASGMNQIRADCEGVRLTRQPAQIRPAAVAFLERWSGAVWPNPPWNTSDIPSRIKALSELKL
jgi:hypothetical protein